ncbi:Serpentine Receptor, class AB (Class A-like) [Caenorhabditis elegans]|nr:Serpentine Receptor, class AB (Class A-like) [Caenorhabditis elegans]CTQ87002.1 Serpentine Receptor, class AB (Class A-like) [Caenorhabditis elegans]|eukprot:NP_001300303.1 Serpentine Receptor, class AB (class A-like) [Caenorhabditis elegans]
MYLWMAPLAVCEKRQYFEICVISRSMYLYGIYSSSFTTVFMAIERTLATYLSHKYEHKNSCVGILLVCFQIIISLLITVPLFLDSKFTTRPDFCEFHDPSDWLLVVEIFTIFSNFVAFLQCWKLYRVNTKLRVHSKVRRLSQKYQIEENKMLIKVILRFTCLDFVFMMVYCFGNLATNFIDFSLSQGKLHGFIEMVHCLPVYAIVVTYSMARVIKHIQKRKTSNLVAEIRIREDAYFSYINNQWTRDTKNKSHK